MKLFVTLCSALALSGCSQLAQIRDTPFDPGRSIVKIQAISANGKQSLGSGVVIAANKVATNCHVTRKAKRAYLSQPDQLYPAIAQAALPELDICILEVNHLDLPPADVADGETVKIGDDVILSGFPFALNLRMTKAKVIGLHPFRDDRIIEINAGFNHGASGGGVFNNSGQLIGLMTFMGPEEAGALHFYVIPANWLTRGLEEEFLPFKPFSARSFWEKGDFVKPTKK